MRFTVCDSATGSIVGRLYPSKWELTDPLRTPGTGSLTVPLPPLGRVGELQDLTVPRRRWVAVQDEVSGRFVWGGPIPRRPARSGGEVVIPLVDWRSWFFHAYIRPVADKYIRYVRTQLDQTLIMSDLMRLGLDTVGAPRIVRDQWVASGVLRDLSFGSLDRSVGEILDTMMNRERGAEWFTYITEDTADPQKLVPHATWAYPERRSRPDAVRVEYRRVSGGNAFDYSWPEGEEAPTRVWAVGDGEPPTQTFASDEYPELAEGAEIAWEDVLGPLDGVVKKATAFEYAFAAVQRSRGRQGEAEFSVLAEKIPLGDVATGDRARIILDDGWDGADVPAARIISRTISGGAGQPTVQRLTVDLADSTFPDDGTTPGVEVAE